MRGFREAMGEDFSSVVSEVAVGMGPCGELRYPSYPGENPGRGACQEVGEHRKGNRGRVGEGGKAGGGGGRRGGRVYTVNVCGAHSPTWWRHCPERVCFLALHSCP